MISIGLKRRENSFLSSDAGRRLALLSDLDLLRSLAATKYAGTAQVMRHFWPNYSGAQISALRVWIIKAIVTKDPGLPPWPVLNGHTEG